MFSGGSGGGYIPRSRQEHFDCSDLSFVTSLNSPKPDVIKLLDIGSILNITKSGESVFAVYQKKTVGSVTHFLYTELLNCISKGNKFVGVVQSISGGNCEIKIIHKSKL